MNNFFTILFTSPRPATSEIEWITYLMESGAIDILHLRRPEASYKELERFILALPSFLHPRIRIHSHFQLCKNYTLNGIHLNSRNPEAPIEELQSNRLSKSCHSIQQANETINSDNSNIYKYITLSPIFPSISKQGYNPCLPLKEITGKIPQRTVALGGIMPLHFKQLADAGFAGAAMLGYVWKSSLPVEQIADEINYHLKSTTRIKQ